MSPTATAVMQDLLPQSARDARDDVDLQVAPQKVRETRRAANLNIRHADLDYVAPLRSWYPPVKHCADWALALVLLLLTGPIILASGILVKMTSRGPMFYWQVRLGRNGRPFRLIKLRTMKYNAEAETGPAWSTANDSRVTGVGALLRQTHLDEFPQLWNVARGEMSLVGPRPERPEFVTPLEEQIPFYRERMSVRPGITGLAQLRLPPDSNLDSVRRKITHDVYYARHVNPLLDLKLLFLTGGRLIGEICVALRERLGLPSTDDIEDGFRRAVGLTGGTAIPLGVPVVSALTLNRELGSEATKIHGRAE